MKLLLVFPWTALGTVTQVVLTLLIAAIAACIAYQQYIVNDRQHRLALFDKRMVIYNKTKEFIAEIVNKPRNVSIPDCLKFARDTRDHEFLFGPEINSFIERLTRESLKLETCNVTNGFEQSAEIINWFVEQMGVATELFKKYVDFRKP